MREFTPRLFVLMLAGVILGVPIVAYVWQTIHQVLALRPEPLRILVSLPLLGVLVVLLRALGNALAGDGGRRR